MQPSQPDPHCERRRPGLINHLLIRFVLASMLCLPTYAAAQGRQVIHISPERPSSPATDPASALSGQRGIYEMVQRSPDSVLRILNHNLKWSMQGGHRYWTVNSLMNIGKLYAYIGKHEYAQDYFRKALVFNMSGTHPVIPATIIHNTIVFTYNSTGHYEEALHHYNDAMSMNQLHGSPNEIAGAYLNVAGILIDLEYASQAAFYIREAEKIIAAHPNERQAEALLTVKGAYYGSVKNWKKSELFFRRYLERVQPNKNPLKIFTGLFNLAAIHLLQQNPEAAFRYLSEAGRYTSSLEINTRIELSAALGEVYMQTGQYQKAEHLLTQALQQAEALKLRRAAIHIHETLSRLYDQTGAPARAYTHLKRYMRMNDSLSGRNRQWVVNQLEVKYRLSEKDRALALQRTQIHQKNLWIVISTSGALFLSMLIALLFSLRRNDINKQNLQQKQISLLQQEQQLVAKEQDIQLLKATITGEEKERNRIAKEMHDGIVGQLAAVRMQFNIIQRQYQDLERTADFQQALQQLDEIAREIRQTTHNLMPEILLERGLTDAVDIFCAKMSRSKRPVISFQLYSPLPRLKPELELSLYRIVQELVQNIVKHAHATTAIVQMGCHEHLLSITVEDNGTGMKDNNESGTGLRNIQNRVSALNGYFDIHNRVNGVTAYLEIDINQQITGTNPLV